MAIRKNSEDRSALELFLGPELGRNEFQAFASPYLVSSTETKFFLENRSLAACDNQFVMLHWDHCAPIGIARLKEIPGQGVYAHGRLAINTMYGLPAAEILHCEIPVELCLAIIPVRSSQAKLDDGAELTIVHEAQPFELSICLYGDMPGTGILRLGNLDLEQSEWDQRFFLAGEEMLLAESAYMTQFLMNSRKAKMAARAVNFDKEKFNEWFRTVQF